MKEIDHQRKAAKQKQIVNSQQFNWDSKAVHEKHCSLEAHTVWMKGSERPVRKNITGSKRFSVPVLLHSVASQALMEFMGGISSVGAPLLNVVCLPNNFRYASSPVKSKVALGKEKKQKQICVYVIPSFLITT